MNISVYKGAAKLYDRVWHNFTKSSVEHILQVFDFKQVPPEQAATLRLLSLASGTAALEVELISRFPQLKIVALDSSLEMLSIGHQKLGGSQQVNFVQSDVRLPLPFPAATFDFVVFANALHYVAKPETLLQEVRRLLKPGGQLIIEDFTVRWPFFWPFFEKLIRLVDPLHHRTYTYEQLVQFVSTAGFNRRAGGCFKLDWWWRGMIISASSPT